MKVTIKKDKTRPMSDLAFGECFRFKNCEDSERVYMKVDPNGHPAKTFYVCLQTGKAYTTTGYDVIPVQMEAIEL